MEFNKLLSRAISFYGEIKNKKIKSSNPNYNQIQLMLKVMKVLPMKKF